MFPVGQVLLVSQEDIRFPEYVIFQDLLTYRERSEIMILKFRA